MDIILRDLTFSVADDIRAVMENGGALPPPVYEARRCEACWPKDLCRRELPRATDTACMFRRIARAGIPE